MWRLNRKTSLKKTSQGTIKQVEVVQEIPKKSATPEILEPQKSSELNIEEIEDAIGAADGSEWPDADEWGDFVDLEKEKLQKKTWNSKSLDSEK